MGSRSAAASLLNCSGMACHLRQQANQRSNPSSQAIDARTKARAPKPILGAYRVGRSEDVQLHEDASNWLAVPACDKSLRLPNVCFFSVQIVPSKKRVAIPSRSPDKLLGIHRFFWFCDFCHGNVVDIGAWYGARGAVSRPMGKAKAIIPPKAAISHITRDVGGSSTIAAVFTANIVVMKARQCAKIGELREALLDAGLISLDQQAAALGLSRSTAWALLKSTHKASGLSASTIRRMLNSPTLPSKARRVIEDYVERKSAGTYGHREHRLRMFRARLNLKAGSAADGCREVQSGSGDLIPSTK